MSGWHQLEHRKTAYSVIDGVQVDQDGNKLAPTVSEPGPVTVVQADPNPLNPTAQREIELVGGIAADVEGNKFGVVMDDKKPRSGETDGEHKRQHSAAARTVAITADAGADILEHNVYVKTGAETNTDTEQTFIFHGDDDMTKLSSQLMSYMKVKSFLSYGAYLKLCRFRMLYYLIAAFSLIVIGVMSFEFSVMFNIVLPGSLSSASSSKGVLAFKMVIAPFVLIGGAWVCDEIIGLLIDAAATDFLIHSRTLIAAYFHMLWHWNAISYGLVTDDKGRKSWHYSGPELNIWCIRSAEFIMPVLFEISPIYHAIYNRATTGSWKSGLVGYITLGIWYGLCYACFYSFLHLLSRVMTKYRVIYLHFATTTPRARREYDMGTLDKENDIYLRPRILNPWRYFVPEEIWFSEKALKHLLLDKFMVRFKTFVENPCTQCLVKSVQCFRRHVKWYVRVILWFILFVAFGLLTTERSIPLAFGWTMVSILLAAIGLEISAKVDLLGVTFSTIFYMFLFFSIALMTANYVELTTDTDIDVTPPTTNVTYFKGASNLATYAVCRNSWEGLSVLDIALVADLTYSKDNATLYAKAKQAFSNTVLQNFTLVHQSNFATEYVFYQHTYHPQINLNIVAVRGTSTMEDLFQDGYMFMAVSLFSFVSKFIPLETIIPTEGVQQLLKLSSLSVIAIDNVYDKVADYVTAKHKNSTQNWLITGHSLGGSLASIVSIKTKIPSVVFSAPGIYYNSRRFGVSTNDLQKYVTNIIPDNDAIARIDQAYGNYQNIYCGYASSTDCHKLSHTICTLNHQCGSSVARFRDFTPMCKDAIVETDTDIGGFGTYDD